MPKKPGSVSMTKLPSSSHTLLHLRGHCSWEQVTQRDLAPPSKEAFRTSPDRAKSDLQLAIALCWEEGGTRWQL